MRRFCVTLFSCNEGSTNMSPQYPKRPYAHTLETKSENYFLDKLPQDWVVHRPNRDYGQDLRIEVIEDGELRGRNLLVQLKASHDSTGKPDYETTKLKISTYNYLMGNLDVAMLIKYVEEADEAYWIMLSDIPSPDQERQTFTVRIPTENRISTIDWNAAVVSRIGTIADKKLRAGKVSRRSQRITAKR
jgi:hypothetical protein